jgi:hypothetical protein
MYRYLEDTAFGPEDIKVIIAAFRAALESLRIVDDKSPMAELIAKNIVDVARRGERDPTLLHERALGPAKVSEAR